MNKIICVIISVIIIAVNLTAEEKRHEINVKYKEIKTEEEIIGKWTFSEEWSGMGLAIEFDKEEFKYWFYSDVKFGKEPVYPIKGKWKISDGVIILTPNNNEHLYATTLVMADDGKNTGLLDPENIAIIMIHKRGINNRLIKKLTADDSIKWPQMNYSSSKK